MTNLGTTVKEPGYSELRDGERDWIEAQLTAARAFVSRSSPADALNPIQPEALDRAFGNWLDTNPTKGEEINDTINAVGVAYGSILVAEQGFDWTIATDEYGTELAVRALPNAGDVLVYPQNFVAKRWDIRERTFLVSGLESTRRHKEQLRAEWEAHRRKS